MRALFPGAAVLGLLLNACASNGAEQSIVGPVWIADAIAAVPVVAGSDVTLQFDAQGRSGGKGGCNTYGAGYRQSGSAITFEQPFSTRMFCAPDELMVQEQAYLDLLGRVISFTRTDDKLELSTKDGKSILFHTRQ